MDIKTSIKVSKFMRLMKDVKKELDEEQFSIFIKKIVRVIGWEHEKVFINPSSRNKATEFKNPKMQAMVIEEIKSRMGISQPNYIKPINPEDGVKSLGAFIAFNFIPIDSMELYH